MRKTIITIILFIVFLIIYFLQANFFPNYTIAGVAPNLFVIFILFIGLYANQKLGVIFGIIVGLFLDSIYGLSIGLSAVMFCIIGFLSSYFDKNFSKDNKLTILFMVIGATIIYEFGLYSLKTIIYQFNFEFLWFLRILLLEVLYNSLITIIIYPIIQKLGYVVDRNFKENNLLTRYF
ncbi:MAG: rod shape-determining protein MreD [Clostridia bacterium]|nr:rod shape-determining protein MreD [Clostridia bacterium]